MKKFIAIICLMLTGLPSIAEITEILPTIPEGAVQIQRRVSITEDLTKPQIEIPIKISSPVTTKSMPEEGDFLDFVTTKDVKIGQKIYPKGTIVNGRIEMVSMNFSLGVPADILISNFSLDKIPLKGEIKKIGANRSIWVKPCAYIGCLCFGAGLLLYPIRGGHAKIKEKEIFTVYYR